MSAVSQVSQTRERTAFKAPLDLEGLTNISLVMVMLLLVVLLVVLQVGFLAGLPAVFQVDLPAALMLATTQDTLLHMRPHLVLLPAGT